MSELKQQIEKKAKTADDIKHLIWQADEQSDDQKFLDVNEEKWVRVSEVLGLFANCVCIPRKQLEDEYKHCLIPQDDSKAGFIKKLLEDSKKKE